MSKFQVIFLSIFLVIAGCAEEVSEENSIDSFEQTYWVEDYAKDLNFPWAITWLPNGDLLVTERLGKIKLIRKGNIISELQGVPEVMVSSPFDGLLDIKIDPDFKTSPYIYLSFTKGTTTERVGVVYRAKIEGNKLVDGEEIFNTSPPAPTGGPNITRINFLSDKSIVAAVGSSGQHAYGMVQRLDGDIGKIIRINRDGSVPIDNALAVKNQNAKAELWATGLRSIGGLTLDDNDQLWGIEMGPQGGDELNLIEGGGNYGFPLVSWGFDYSGRALSEKQTAAGFVDPVVTWSPSISPYGITFYQGEAFPKWNGDFFVGVLGDQTILRMRISDGKLIEQQDLLYHLNERIRSVETGPDGFIYAVTDSSNGKIIRLRPGTPSEKELANVSKPFPMPKNSDIGERLRQHGVMQNEETMLAIQAAYDSERAKFIYNQNCVSCHSLTADSESNIGPHLESIAGRRSGSLPNYNYSAAMKMNNQTSVIWDSRTIAAYITNPQAIFPGTKMVSTPLNFEDAVQVSNYLTRLSPKEN
jgi:glucose/arabinose dehydrogenase/cytochrome c2